MLGANRHSKAGLKFDALQNPVGWKIVAAPNRGDEYRRLNNSTHLSAASIEKCTSCKRARCNGACDEILALERQNVDPRKRENGKLMGYQVKRKYTYRGKQYSSRELAQKAGISMAAFHSRLKHGWTVEEAVETPMRGKRRKE